MGRDRVLQDDTQLVRTAFAIIDSDGYERFSARKLAEVLGISHMTVYNYMERDELLNQVIIMGFSILNETIVPHAEECKRAGNQPCSIFTYIAGELLEFGKRHPNIYRFMFQSRLGLATEDVRTRHLYSSGLELIKDAIPTDRFEALQSDSYLFFVLVNGLVLGYLGLRHSTTDTQCRRNMLRAYELLLGSYCS